MAAEPDQKMKDFFARHQREAWSKTKVWKEMIPQLSISSCCGRSNSTDSGKKVDTASLRQGLIEDGYSLVNDWSPDDKIVSNVAEAIAVLHMKYGLPATFILLFDEAWHIANETTNSLLKQVSHANIFNFDVLAWYIDPKEGSAGFSPHRDRQPCNDDVSKSFHTDGLAKYVTIWMALSEATPENSCLYFIPKPFDPGYMAGDDVEDESSIDASVSDPLSRALSSKESYQNIRAIPRKAGQSVIFTHRILHWGSRGNPRASRPRIAISFVASDPSFERPYIKHWEKYWGPTAFEIKLPPFRIRLLLVCAQLLIYYQRFSLPKESIRACYEYCKDNSNELDETYWEKVSVEFIKAIREEIGVSTKHEVKIRQGSKEEEDEEEEEEEIDAMLGAMLDNADHADIGDDFDDFEDTDTESPPFHNTRLPKAKRKRQH